MNIQSLGELTIDALKAKVKDIRTQVQLGLMNSKEAHDLINKIAAVIMQKQVAALEADNSGEPSDEYGFGKED